MRFNKKRKRKIIILLIIIYIVNKMVKYECICVPCDKIKSMNKLPLTARPYGNINNKSLMKFINHQNPKSHLYKNAVQGIRLKKELDRLNLEKAKLIDFPRYNQEPVFSFIREGTIGFENPSKELISVLNIWANFIYQPLLEDKVRLINPSASGQYGRETAEKVHEELKKIGGVKPPREFVLMDRAAVGLGSVFMHLKAEVNWYRIFNDLVGNFNEQELLKKQQAAMKKSGLIHKY